MLTAAVAQIVLPAFCGPRFAAHEQPPNVLQPASATFTVWFPIFATALRHAIFQAMPGRSSDAVLRAVGGPASVAYAATGIWAPLVRTRRYWWAQGALFVIAGSAEVARRRVAVARADGSMPADVGRVLTPPVAMLSAWGAAASAVNLGAMLVAEEPVPEGQPVRLTGAALTAATAATALAASASAAGGLKTAASRIYLGTVAWALGGIVVGQWRRSRLASGTATGGLLVVAGALGVGIAG